MEWERDIKIKCIVVKYTDREEQYYHTTVSPKR